MLITRFSVTELLAILLVSIIFIYYIYYKRCFNYWKKKNLPTVEPTFPFGNLSSSAFGRQSVYTRLENLYNYFKNKGYKHAGIYFFNGPIYFPIDPDLIRRIMVTDFDYFVDRGMYGNGKELPLSSHIFSMTGSTWKNIRTKLNPSFSSSKIKSIYNIVACNCENLIKYIEPFADEKQIIDIKDIFLRFTADVIGSTSFGIDSNSLENPNNKFAKMVKKMSNHSVLKLIRVALEEGLQNPGNIEKIAYNDKVIEMFFTNLVKDMVEYRDKNNIVRNDFLHMLMQMRDTDQLPIEEIVSQAYLFFIAGFKTTALTLCYCICELSCNQEWQNRVRTEVYENLGKDISKYNYEELIILPTLDKIIKETMRKYPPLPMLNRLCVKNYKVPKTEITIDKNTPVVISLMGLQRDSEYFPEPLKFDPDRFSNQILKPFTYLPFGDGPRNCIGLRFGMVTLKLAVASLLSRFQFSSISETPRDLPIDTCTTSILYNVAGSIKVGVTKINVK